MSRSAAFEDMETLLTACMEGVVAPSQSRRIEDLLENDPDALDAYVAMMNMHAMLEWRYSVALGDSEEDPAVPIFPPLGNVDLPPLITSQHAPACPFDGLPLATLVASLVVGVGLLIGSMIHIARPDPSLAKNAAANATDAKAIGRITGMVDCRWQQKSHDTARNATTKHIESPLCLGDQLNLASGLVELTCDSGATVILQGPASYRIDAPDVGYLAAGKLAAKVTKTPAAVDDPAGSPRFAVKTPTAVVTDLGTEFGVEVDAQGATTSRVYRGSVEVRANGDDAPTRDAARVLQAGEQVRVENGGRIRQVSVGDDGSGALAAEFVRTMPAHVEKTVDLVDVVAGGDGFSSRRGRGIVPTTGQTTDRPLAWRPPPHEYLVGDHRYHAVDSLPFVDGVFVPDGSKGPLQIDSTGRTFGSFLSTSNEAAGCIWAGGAIPHNGGAGAVVNTVLDNVDYASPGHGLLFLHSNSGITFSLDAVRAANRGFKIACLHAVVGTTDASGDNMVDYWVIVDGQLRFRRREMNTYTGVSPIRIPLGERDQFLTFAVTDGGDSIRVDWVIFGDPQLDLQRQP